MYNFETQVADRVDARGLAWQHMASDLDLIQDLMGGTSAMRRAGLRWLPRETAESWPAWRARLHRTVLFNGLARTIQALSGRPFSQPVRLESGHADLQAIAGNMDGCGQGLSAFSQHLLFLLLRDGLVHILLDRPVKGGQPYCVIQPAGQLIAARLGPDNKLADIRLRHKLSRPVGRFGEKQTDVIRYFNKQDWEVWHPAASTDKWNIADKGRHDLGDVPLITLNANPTGFMMARPPLMDLAWLNLAHWQSSSDQRHILHVARVPILFGRAMQIRDDQLDIGPNRLILADDPAADLRFVEHSGAAIAAGRQDLIDLEDKMAVMGLELLTHQPGHVTATARALDAAQNHAALTGVLQVLEDGLNRTFRLAAKWMGLTEDTPGQVRLSRRWQIADDRADIADWLLRTRQAGEISQSQFLAEVERHGLLMAPSANTGKNLKDQPTKTEAPHSGRSS